MQNLQEFYIELNNTVQHETVHDEDRLPSEVFLSRIAEEYMKDQGMDIDNNDLISFQKQGYGRCDGYSFDPVSKELCLFIADYDAENHDAVQHLTNTDIERLTQSLLLFYSKACTEKFLQQMEESAIAYELISSLIQLKKENNVSQIKLILISNKTLSKSVKKIKITDRYPLDGIEIYCDIWDLNRIYQIYSSRGESEAIEIDFQHQSLPTLMASESTEITSYMCIIRGDQLADLYEQYTGRLLEENVRSFLQFRGKVNKGIRKTIQMEPQYFFAYNNGITATADDISTDENGHIIWLKNLQIVNGGQTIVSLYQTRKNSKEGIDLSVISVQMKLNLIHSESAKDELLPKIAQYANSQNKISDSDLSSNQPFHREFEALSRRIWAPVKENEIRQTHWFYDRARGSYLNAQAGLSDRDKKVFLEQNPKNQVITKTDLAKLKLIFDDQPYHAVKGAEIAFTTFNKILDKISKKDGQFDKSLYNDEYFRVTIAQQIVWLECRDFIKKNKSYMGNTKAILAAYTVSVINELLKAQNLELNYEDIWNRQSCHMILREELQSLAEKIYTILTNNARYQNIAVLSYSKTRAAYEASKIDCQKECNFSPAFLNMVTRSLGTADKNICDFNNKVSKKIDDLVMIQKKLFELKPADWDRILNNIRSHGWLTELDIKLVEMISNLQTGRTSKVPSDKQCLKIYELLVSLENHDYFIFSD